MRKKIINVLGITILVVVCFIYLYSKGTYTIFESKINGQINPNIAAWSIKVNDVVVTTNEEVVVDISDVTWSTPGIADNKVAPGSVGVLDINIDPMNTDVAIKYDIEIIDKNIDTTKILTVSSVAGNGLIKTGVSTYTGIITLDEISSGTIENIKLNIEWIDSGEDIDFDTVTDNNEDYLAINFTATQYRGEEISPYVS